MIYAVNKRTKEHRRYSEATFRPSHYEREWEVIEADADGWIPWQGGECPLPEGAPFEARRRDGAIIDQKCVNFWGRNEKDDESDIIAYRPILGADTMPEAPEWGGEGLPPVGCECEWKHKRASDDQWVPCQIVGYHDEWVFVVDGANSGMPAVKKVATWRFRPIRSEEDRALDVMLEDVETKQGVPMSRDAARALYRAGYRKQEAQ